MGLENKVLKKITGTVNETDRKDGEQAKSKKLRTKTTGETLITREIRGERLQRIGHVIRTQKGEDQENTHDPDYRKSTNNKTR